ncbi:unnamed protein product [Miscanthus lutarioriparius]|uniref:CCHC-type domain-containing protein n=1 Tax=Miscanthus lutarioriparius TaxID=422564 RepID=A0A811P1H5_9POAL|nr:unnamed protein product [Miscanthus lutarioriparius]
MAPDAEGFRQVQSRRRWRRVASPRRPVPSNLVGLCFNCLAGDHVHADCTFPAKCYNFRDVGHQARACPHPPVAGRWEGKRGRSPPRASGFRWGARRRRSSPSRGASPVDTVSAHLASTGREPSVPPVCQPPTPEPQVNDPPAGNAGQPLPAAGPSEVAGDAVADGPLDQPPAPELPRLIPRALLRTPALQAAEDALSMALLALLVGTWPVVTPTMVLDHLEEHFGIPDDRVSVRRTRPNDFIVRFSRREDLERVLSAAPPERAPFTLQWRRWSRLIMGLAGAFRFRVLVAMKGIPSHARSKETAQAILGSSCTNVEFANPEALADPDDESELFVAAWCAHPDLIPDEMIMAVPEPEEHDGGPPLFLRPHEIIHDEIIQDWHTPPPSSDDGMDFGGDDSDSGDSNFNGYHPGFGASGGGGARPRTSRFGSSDEPRLGWGSGPVFWPRELRSVIVVGDVTCPILAPRSAIPCPGVSALHARAATRVEEPLHASEPMLSEAVDICLSGPEDCGSGPTSRMLAQLLIGEAGPSQSSPPSHSEPRDVDDPGFLDVVGHDLTEGASVQTSAATTTDEFISIFKKPLSQLVLPSTPRARVTRSERALETGDEELVPKRSARLAAKSKNRVPRPKAQVRKVTMKRLGVEVETELPDEASFDEFQTAFKLPLSPSTWETMQVLFPGSKQRTPKPVRAA